MTVRAGAFVSAANRKMMRMRRYAGMGMMCRAVRSGSFAPSV